MNTLFTKFLLHEDIPPDPTVTNKKPQPKMEMPNADKSVQPPDDPPDLTSEQPSQGGGGDLGAAMGAPPGGAGNPADPSAAGGDPSMAGADPNANPDGSGDPNADPNAAGAGDPSAAGLGDPNAAMGGGVQSPEAQIEQDEKDVFSDLKPGQLVIQRGELRDKYKMLYSTIVDSLEKINKISHTTYDDTMLDFIVKKLMGMKIAIKDTLIDTFSTRTYVENKIELQRFITTFNRLTNMLTEIYKSRLQRNDAISRLNTDKKPRQEVDFPVFSRGYDIQ